MKRIMFYGRVDNYAELRAKLTAQFGARFLGFPNSDAIAVVDDFTAQEEKQLKDIINKRDCLDSVYDTSKLRNMTIAQVDNAIDGIGSLADAKAKMKILAHVVLWLLKREMDELQTVALGKWKGEGKEPVALEPSVKKKSWWRRLLRR